MINALASLHYVCIWAPHAVILRVALNLPLNSTEHTQRDSKFLHHVSENKLKPIANFNKCVLQLPNMPILASANAFHQTYFGVSSLN